MEEESISKEEIERKTKRYQRKAKLNEIDPSEMDKLKTKYELPNCAFCFDSLEKDLCFTHCGHVFHEKCIENYIKVKPICPTCREDISKEGANKLYFPIKKTILNDSERVNFLKGLKGKNSIEIDQNIFDKNEFLMDKIITIEERMEKVRQDNNETMKTNKNLEKVHEKFKKMINDLLEENNDLKEKLKKAEEEKTKKSKELSTRAKEIKNLKRKEVELLKYKNRFESESDYKVKGLMREKDDMSISLEIKCDRFYDCALQYLSKFNSLSEQHLQTISELGKLRNKDQSYLSEIKDLKDKITLRDNEIKELNENLSRRISQLKQFKKRIDDKNDFSGDQSVTFNNLEASKSVMRKIKILKEDKKMTDSEINFKKLAKEEDLNKFLNQKQNSVKKKKVKKKLHEIYKERGLHKVQTEDKTEILIPGKRKSSKKKEKPDKNSMKYLFNPGRIKVEEKLTQSNMMEYIKNNGKKN